MIRCTCHARSSVMLAPVFGPSASRCFSSLLIQEVTSQFSAPASLKRHPQNLSWPPRWK